MTIQTNKPNSLTLNFNFAKPLRPNEVKPVGYGIVLKPQLAYDPKIGEDYSLFLDYAKTQNPIAWASEHRFVAEPKMDGVRGQFVVELQPDGSLLAYCLTRANRRLTSVDHLLADLESNEALAKLLSNQSGFDKLVIDSELTVYNADNSNEEFRYINGLANRKNGDAETARLSAYIFSIYFIDDHGNCTSTVDPFRFEHFIYSPTGLGLPENGHWASAPRYYIGSAEQLASLCSKLKAKSWEGIVLKSMDYRHFNGRTKHWLKLKFRRTGTFKLLGVELGEGKCANTCGAIKIGDAIGQTTMVGTGMTDSDRDELMSLDYINHSYYIQVSYMTKTGSSLREPVYQAIRYELTDSPNPSLDIFQRR